MAPVVTYLRGTQRSDVTALWCRRGIIASNYLRQPLPPYRHDHAAHDHTVHDHAVPDHAVHDLAVHDHAVREPP